MLVTDVVDGYPIHVTNFKSPIFSHQHQVVINIIFAISISVFLKANGVF